MRKSLSKEDHQKLGKLINETTTSFGEFSEKIWKAYGVNSKESRAFGSAMKMLSGKFRCLMDESWFEHHVGCHDDVKNPYYNGSGIAF